ncbi:thioredoxin domain-containing protein [Phyllobacterium sp. YR531]|uniref:thioredoxin domain-containing protein n=1 Tax=Phyllobacterium sp. YR531 TaxID=1144343 RepID=UPI00026FCC70|nr:thioredoxin domain-containing protein [Phyllobacterium sp. YR531]EJM99889.1 conserved thioredoxin domain protein containing protein [Phyllobacterium sp. YR531]
MFEAANLLGTESSPYLRQHADNPVHWRPWGRSALDEAISTNKPILLSVGYAACHWCHVMAHECFGDNEVAHLMNDLYINIKVDREERPDIDQIYMAALGAMGEQGGWPLTMFLTPEGKPFWGGTYFPKHSHYGRPGFLDVLRSIYGVWRNDRQRVDQNVTALTRHISERLDAKSERTEIDPALFNQFASNIYGAMDPVKGGLSGAPKFPSAPFMDTIWLSWLRDRDETHRDIFVKTLETMLQGGIYDHLGGGLSRYSVDDAWLVPHFEKMLYDNAQFIRHATFAFGDSGNTLFRSRIEETIAWLEREMLVDGRFASSLDADSEGEEGRFYVWHDAEIPLEFNEFRNIYDVTSVGNWEGKNILNRLNSIALLDERTENKLADARKKLLVIRDQRIRPERDDKALTDWNGLMIRALAEAGRAFGRSEWISLAESIYRSVSESMVDGRLPHSVLGDSRLFPGLSSDYATMINAAVSLHQATQNDDYMDAAKHWKRMLDAWHQTENGDYSLSANDSTDTIIRVRGDQDEAIPSATSQIIEALARLALLSNDEQLRQHVNLVAENALGRVLQQRYGQAGVLNSSSLLLDQTKLVIVTPEKTHALMHVANQNPDPRRIDLWIKHIEEQTIELVPGGGGVLIKKPAAFLCRGFVCLAPVETEAELEALLRSRV